MLRWQLLHGLTREPCFQTVGFVFPGSTRMSIPCPKPPAPQFVASGFPGGQPVGFPPEMPHGE